MSAIRNVLLWVFFGALAGVWTGGFVAQKFVPWFNTPANAVSSLCQCKEVTVDTVNRTLSYQLVGMLVGAVAFMVIGLVFGAGRSKKPEPPAAAATPAT